MTIGSYLIDLSMLPQLSIDFSCPGFAKEMIAAQKTRERVIRQRYVNMGMGYVDPMDKDKDDLRDVLIPECEKIDKQIAGSVDTIAASCPLLMTFTMHLLTADVRGDDFLQVILEKSDESPVEHTIEAFTNLRIRDTVCIVAVANPDQYTNLRRGIAPLDKRRMRELEKWPGFRITKGEIEMFSMLFCFEDGYGDRDEDLHLRMWYF